MASLDDFKTMIGLASDDTSQDSILSLILKNTDLQLRFKLGLDVGEPVPSELAYIPIEVAVRRYNRLKNEGMSSYTQEGESISFNSNDFDDFQADIADWRKRNNTGVLTVIDPFRKRGFDNDF